MPITIEEYLEATVEFHAMYKKCEDEHQARYNALMAGFLLFAYGVYGEFQKIRSEVQEVAQKFKGLDQYHAELERDIEASMELLFLRASKGCAEAAYKGLLVAGTASFLEPSQDLIALQTDARRFDKTTRDPVVPEDKVNCAQLLERLGTKRETAAKLVENQSFNLETNLPLLENVVLVSNVSIAHGCDPQIGQSNAATATGSPKGKDKEKDANLDPKTPSATQAPQEPTGLGEQHKQQAVSVSAAKAVQGTKTAQYGLQTAALDEPKAPTTTGNLSGVGTSLGVGASSTTGAVGGSPNKRSTPSPSDPRGPPERPASKRVRTGNKLARKIL
ncbi:uncharacterized protein EI97DRAFT_498385 [Westerdykella ornata]|uniref:Uncharacterized protein n=1 Tax=Westerdykella ornata TaxID=318751 RepID=A0A6A6JV76_WESOR|nr:uncharacterized protein EI97DRAFT_498385 [Westerdykella ornata]KAF2280124.1 hypothetical protein EI97DRAFT_498385 [Westerdykella ornata]